MTERRGHHEGLDPVAMAALRALREDEEVPAAARERVWARLAAATGEEAGETGSKRQVSWARSSGPWVVVVLAAALVLLVSRAGVLDRLVASRGGEAARYTEVERAGQAEAAAAGRAARAGSSKGQAAADAGVPGGAAAGQAAGQAAEVEGPGAEGAAGSAAGSRPEGQAAGAEGAVSGGAKEGETDGPSGHAPMDVSGETSAAARGERAGRGGQGGAPGAARTEGEEAGALAAEAEALARAQAALQDGQADAALAELAGYARRFPRGVLREEHDALRAIALCSAGRSREGRGEAQAFLKARPGSALAERVRGACLGS